MLGDYVDRGPDTKRTLDLLIDRGNNHEAVVNGLVFFDGVTDPIEVDEDGSWEYDLIPLSCTKIRATADFCVDYEADITITAGQDTEINIDMVDAV